MLKCVRNVRRQKSEVKREMSTLSFDVSLLTSHVSVSCISMNIDTFHYLETIRKYILALPGVEEYTSSATPGFRVNKKLLARLREDGETLVVRSEERGMWMKKDPSIYFITDHYAIIRACLSILPK
jgi:hypothetical protein